MKEFNAREALKGFDPTATEGMPRLYDLELSEPISDEEWDDYNEAKEACEREGGDWKKERSEEHARIARIYAKACEAYRKKHNQ